MTKTVITRGHLPYGAGSTVPREGFDLKCYYAFFLVCCGCDTSYRVSVHIQFQASIYTLSLCRGHSWQVRLAKQETLTPPGHLASPLVCSGPWMSNMVLYCWCHSDSTSVLLYFTLKCFTHPFILILRAPGSVPHCGTCLCSNCWDQIPRPCHVFTRLFTSNIPWYFLDFAFIFVGSHKRQKQLTTCHS